MFFLFAAAEAMNLGLKYEFGRNYFLKQVRSRVMKQTQGVYPAPLRIVDVCCTDTVSKLSATCVTYCIECAVKCVLFHSVMLTLYKNN